MNTKSQYPTGENRKSLHQYSDPLILNFKLLIEFDGKDGLFGDEKYPNTALAYLKRIGEDERYELLKHLILLYKNFTKNLDFLVKSVEGLDRISNFPPSQMFGYDEDKITIHTDETVDMYVMSMVYLYREICYDMTNRKVVVLPTNLRYFNCNILLFASGYFSADYDKAEPDAEGNVDNDISKSVLPTKKKLSYGTTNEYESILHESYNHTIFKIEGCQFLVDECGKNFIANVSNEMSDDIVKNNLTFSFNSAHFSGRFNNIIGDKDVTKILFESALINKQSNIDNNNTNTNFTLKGIVKDMLLDAGKTVAKQSLTKLKAVGVKKLNNIFGTEMMFPPIQEISLTDRLIKAGSKLFDSGLQKTETETREIQNNVKSMLFNNFLNQLLNGFIIPVVNSPTLFPSTAKIPIENTNTVSILPNQQPNVVTGGGIKLSSNERFPIGESNNKTKLFF